MKYNRTSKMPWGSHKSNQIRFIPDDYLEWVKDNVKTDDDLVEACSDELNERKYKREHLGG